jgi:hypothetical protein
MQIFNIKKIFLLDCALVFWVLFTCVITIIPRSFLINLTYVILSLIILVSIVCCKTKENRSRDFYYIFLYFIATFIPLSLGLLNGRYSVLYYWMMGVVTILAITFLIKIPLPTHEIIAKLLIILCFAIGGLLVLNYGFEVDSESLIGGRSNLLSATLIKVVCWYCFIMILVGHKEPILVPLVLLIFAIYLGGRSGIVISFGILLISALFRATRSKISLIAITLIIPLLAWFFAADIFLDIVDGTRLRHGFEDDIRTEMIKEYINGIGPINLLIGGEFDPSGIIASYGGNPHNSFIRAHQMFGIVPIAFFALALTISVFALLSSPTRVSAYGFILGGLILLRSFYDSVTFWLEMDFIILILLLNPILLTTLVHGDKRQSRSRRVNLGAVLGKKTIFTNRYFQ